MAAGKQLTGAGLRGQVAGKTSLSTVGKSGSGLTYRGYDVSELAEQCIFEDHHPAIIDKATFSLVQELKEKRNRTNYRGSRGQWLGSEIPNPFGSCLFCKDCGSRLTPIKRQTSSRERKFLTQLRMI